MAVLNGVEECNAPLSILIVGAGIGGLTAAVALREAGHSVTLVESSKFSNETGAAIHLAPNCSGILGRLGIKPEEFGANHLEGINICSHLGETQAAVDYKATRKQWRHDWLLIHRAHLHSAIRERALSNDGKGTPCQLRLGSRVSHVDPHAPSLTLENGDVLRADLILGADGVHSQCRKALEGGRGYIPYDGGDSAFRFLVPMKDILGDPISEPVARQPGRMYIVSDNKHRRLVMYPCSNSSLMNCVLLHPSIESRSTDQVEWNQPGEKSRMLAIVDDFAPQFKAVVSKAPEDTLKVWTLLDLPVLPTWVNGKMALLGDAAHPFLPHQAQGGAQAIEDAMAIATLLPRETSRAEIPERLELYMKCRQERANKIQAMTRLSGKSWEEQRRVGYSPFTFHTYNFGHDAYDHARNILKQHLWSKQAFRYRQPLRFGPAPGPLQPRNQLSPHLHHDHDQHQTIHTARFTTSRTYLESALPSSFTFTKPDTVAQASLLWRTYHNLEWLSGGSYEQVELHIHGIQHISPSRSSIHGSFILVRFANLSDAVTAAREDLGLPAYFADITPTINTEGASTVEISWRGQVFGKVCFEKKNTEPALSGSVKSRENETYFYQRYLPAVGSSDKADAEYTVMVSPTNKISECSERGANGTGEVEYVKQEEPTEQEAQTKHETPTKQEPLARNENPTEHDQHTPTTEPTNSTELTQPNNSATQNHHDRTPLTGASLEWLPGDWHTLPTLHHVASFVAEMPVIKMLDADVRRTSQVGDYLGARRME